MDDTSPDAVAGSWVRRLGADAGTHREHVVVEEPLAIRLAVGNEVRRVATTMRTPGHDLELAVGFLLAEGVVRRRADIVDVSRCARWEHDDPTTDHADHDHAHLATVTLRGTAMPDLAHLDRHGVMTSACGVCGRASIDALTASGVTRVSDPAQVLSPEVLHGLPARMRTAQATFADTGGIHAAARFTFDGDLLGLREDVGRHNALDKLVGAALLDGDVPLSDQVVLLSGRASYELLVKAAVAGVAVVAAIGAPSSLAVDVADEFGVTLVGFLRHDHANVHTNAHRIDVPAGASTDREAPR